jgi:NDP-sugar pyrophosphorylase family protein
MTPNDVMINTRAVEDCHLVDTMLDRRHVDHEVTGVIVAGVHRWGGDVLDQFGSRLLLPVVLRPLIEHGVQWLTRSGLDDVCVCANSNTRAIRECLGSVASFGSSVRYYEDEMPRGPAGCVRDAAIDTTADTIVVLEGSVIPSFDLHKLIETHRREDAAMTIAVIARSLNDGDGADRPAGVYVLSKSVVPEVSATGYQDLKEVLVPKLYDRGHRIAVHPVACGSVSRVLDAVSYLEANLKVALRMVSRDTPWDGFVREGDAWVHESAKVDPSARVLGAVVVGPEVRVEAEAMIVGPTVVGSGCTIGQGAVISRSVLWSRCKVGHCVIVDHSLLTDGACTASADVHRDMVLSSRRWFGLRTS